MKDNKAIQSSWDSQSDEHYQRQCGDAGAINVLRMIKPYAETGPFGDPPDYQWRVCDFANGLISCGFRIVNMDEFHAEMTAIGAHWWELEGWDAKMDWHITSYAALPQWLSFGEIK